MEPMSENDRLFAVLRILLMALNDAMNDPDTEMSEECQERFAAELRVADAMLPRPVR